MGHRLNDDPLIFPLVVGRLGVQGFIGGYPDGRGIPAKRGNRVIQIIGAVVVSDIRRPNVAIKSAGYRFRRGVLARKNTASQLPVCEILGAIKGDPRAGAIKVVSVAVASHHRVMNTDLGLSVSDRGGGEKHSS